MLHMPSPTLLGGGADGYAAFVAHIGSRGVPALTTTPQGEGGSFVVTASNSAQYTGLGSCWAAVPGYNGFGDGQLYDVMAHGLPSKAVLDQQIANSWKIFMTINAVGDPEQFVDGANRNGYTTFSGALRGYQLICLELLYWDGTSAKRMRPSAAVGPETYTF